MTKAVLSGETMVGVPGRAIKNSSESEEGKQHRQAIADKLGFDAYGVSDMPDPIALSIKKMLDHIHAQDERINTMCKALKQIDKNFKANDQLTINDQEVELASCCPEDDKPDAT